MLSVLARGVRDVLVTLAIVTVLTFLLVALMPGDPARIVAGEFGTPESIAAARRALLLDQPWHERYARFVGNAVQGDFGTSLAVRPGTAVWHLITEVLPKTLSLSVVALVIAVVAGVPMGFLAAAKRGTWIDRVVAGFSAVSLSVPSFVLAILLVTTLAINRDIFPALGYAPLSDGLWEWLRHLVLPGAALAAIPAAELARQTRGALADTFAEDYVRTARARGLPRRTVIVKHAAKNAGSTVTVVIGLQAARIIAGSVVVEQVFAISGIGTLTVEAVRYRDIAVIQALVLVVAVFVVLVNMVVDLANGYFDPRSRS